MAPGEPLVSTSYFCNRLLVTEPLRHRHGNELAAGLVDDDVLTTIATSRIAARNPARLAAAIAQAAAITAPATGAGEREGDQGEHRYDSAGHTHERCSPP